MADFTPILYVIVRPLDSMNPGKAQAHSGHAASAFCKRAWKNPKVYKDWLNATPQGFGTQINLTAGPTDTHFDMATQKICRAMDDMDMADLFPYEWITDPTYPYIVSSELLGLIPKETHTLPPTPMKNGEYRCYRKETTAFYFYVGMHDDFLMDVIKSHTSLAP